jgi:hypothetical protein
MTKKVPAAASANLLSAYFHLASGFFPFSLLLLCNTKGLSVNILFPKVQDNHGSEPHDADQDAFVFGPSIR